MVKVTGLSINDIMSISNKDFNSLSEKDLKALTSRLASASNKRLRRLEKSDVGSPSLESVKRSGGDFSVKGKDLNQLRSEFARAKNFLNAKTSTVRGAKQVSKAFTERTGIKLHELTKEEQNKFWNLVNNIGEYHPTVLARYDSNQRQELVSKVFKEGADYDDLRNDLRDYLDELDQPIDTEDWFSL